MSHAPLPQALSGARMHEIAEATQIEIVPRPITPATDRGMQGSYLIAP